MQIPSSISDSATSMTEQCGQLSTTSTISTKISFNITKKEVKQIVIQNKLAGKHEEVASDEEEESETRKRTILHLENGVAIDAEGPQRKKDKKVYCIPVLRHSTQTQIERLRKLEEEGNATEQDKARLTLLLEAIGQDSDGIPILDGIQQKIDVPNLGVGGNMMPTVVEPDETDPDYDCMPVGEFGLAFLRGCGWQNEKTAIGKTNAQAVPLRITTPRPKGLGLGATLPSATPTTATNDVKKSETTERRSTNGRQMEEGDGEEESSNSAKTLGKNAYVKCLGGLNKNAYGKVTSMDVENSSVFIEIGWPQSKMGKTVRASQFAVEVIPLAEYLAKTKEAATQQQKQEERGGGKRDENGKQHSSSRRKT